ncbi:hypothetical protein Tco_1317747 [Tanacetum coccineum]
MLHTKEGGIYSSISSSLSLSELRKSSTGLSHKEVSLRTPRCLLLEDPEEEKREMQKWCSTIDSWIRFHHRGECVHQPQTPEHQKTYDREENLCYQETSISTGSVETVTGKNYRRIPANGDIFQVHDV